MPFVKGQSGNLAGRPRKNRPFAETVLERAFDRNPDCPVYSNQQVLAILIWNGLTTGYVHFGGNSYRLTRSDWIELVKWASHHMDGALISTPPPDLGDSIADFEADYPIPLVSTFDPAQDGLDVHPSDDQPARSASTSLST